MEESDIIASGILQAMKRGEHKSKAMQTFLNAGYSREIVEKAVVKAETLNRDGFSVAISSPKPVQNVQQRGVQTRSIWKPKIHQPPKRNIGFRPRPPQQVNREEHLFQAERPKNKKVLTWIITILIIILTLGVNGYLIWKYTLS